MSEIVKTDYPKYFFISNIASINRNLRLISGELKVVVVGSAGGSKQGVVMVTDPEIVAQRDLAKNFVMSDREKSDPEVRSEVRANHWAVYEAWNSSVEISREDYEKMISKANPVLGDSSHRLAPTSITSRDLGKAATRKAQEELIQAEVDATNRVVESVESSGRKADGSKGMGLLSVGKTPVSK